jgi:histidinol-phosphate/aromatic aminotransferase/cobyric acid decarboxylase-like protein
MKLDDYIALKTKSGSHSPSIFELETMFPDVKIEVDACFLSNPYATDLFFDFLQKDILSNQEVLRKTLEFYPPQNTVHAKLLAPKLGLRSENIFVTNGAIEGIQAVVQSFVKESICVILPTFSSYYEFVNRDVKIYEWTLQKEQNFELDLKGYVDFIIENEIRNVVLINPNNPNGGYLSYSDMEYVCNKLKNVDNIIIDESFAHFASENLDLDLIKYSDLLKQHENVIVIKSMSKDFGIAGIRAGYVCAQEPLIRKLRNTGYLWNMNGLATYFFNLYSSKEFDSRYEVVRKKYIMNAQTFERELSKIEGFKIYPSSANFFLVEVLNGKSSTEVFFELLTRFGIYVRDCSDKVGLNNQGEFLRIACRSFEENLIIVNGLKGIK